LDGSFQPFSEFYTRFGPVGKNHARNFKSGLDCGYRAGIESFASLKASNGIGGNLRSGS